MILVTNFALLHLSNKFFILFFSLIVPGAIPELHAFPMGASILHLRWIKPEEPNGVLTGYRIEYQVVKGTALMQPKERAPITNPDETETKLAGLEPGTTYRITVRATTSQGPGDPFFIEVTTRSNVTGRKFHISIIILILSVSSVFLFFIEYLFIFQLLIFLILK